MSDWLLLLLMALGVYRAAHMVVFEDGPFDVFIEIRSWATSRFGFKHWIVKGLNCPLCTSFWLAAAGAAATVLLGRPPALFLPLWFGLAGAALVLDSAIGALQRHGGKQ